MANPSKLAREWYQETFNELRNLMNQHYQISQASPFHESLPALAARIRRIAACCETWKAVAKYNVSQKFFKGG